MSDQEIESYLSINMLIIEHSSVLTLLLILMMDLHKSTMNVPSQPQIKQFGSMHTMVTVDLNYPSIHSSKLDLHNVKRNLPPCTESPDTLLSMSEKMPCIPHTMVNSPICISMPVKEPILIKTTSVSNPILQEPQDYLPNHTSGPKRRNPSNKHSIKPLKQNLTQLKLKDIPLMAMVYGLDI